MLTFLCGSSNLYRTFQCGSLIDRTSSTRRHCGHHGYVLLRVGHQLPQINSVRVPKESWHSLVPRLHYYETGCPTLRGVRSVGTTKSTQCPARTGNRCFIRAENPSAREETSEDLRERKIERDFSTAPHNKIRNSCDIQPLLKPANAPRLDTMCAIDPAQDLNSQAPFHAQNLERPNSLFRNILPLTRLESRFCVAPLTAERRNSNQSNILRVRAEKRTHQSGPANSLFGNILPVKYLESIFCEPHQHLAIVTTRKQGFCQIDPKKYGGVYPA
jgi:hypothetical protein